MRRIKENDGKTKNTGKSEDLKDAEMEESIEEEEDEGIMSEETQNF